MIDYLNSVIDTHQQWGKRPALIVLPAQWHIVFVQQLKDQNPNWPHPISTPICFRGVTILCGFRTVVVEFEEELPLED